MSHFDIKPVLVKLNQTLFKRTPDRAMRPFPVLLLHNLRRAHFFDGGFFKRRLYPKFKFSRGSEGNVDNIFSVDFKPAYFGVTVKQIDKFLFDVKQSIRQNCAGVYAFSFVNQKTWYAQSSDWTIGNVIVMLKIIIDKPIYGMIHRHINFGIVKRGNSRQDNGTSVSLHCAPFKKIVHVFEENSHGNFFVGIVARQVNSHHRHKFYFGVFAQHLYNFFLRGVSLNRIK